MFPIKTYNPTWPLLIHLTLVMKHNFHLFVKKPFLLAFFYSFERHGFHHFASIQYALLTVYGLVNGNN